MTYNLSDLQAGFTRTGYICDDSTSLTVFLALALQKPLLVEGAPGVGKTELGKTLAAVLDSRLIRLQCYEGLDETKALYEWNYQRQLLRIQLDRELATGQLGEEDLFSESYLLERPLLKAIRSQEPVVLLIDEVDKCDPEFEAFLFEVLSDFQVSIPELGTMKAERIPVVVLTSNNERELSDGLKRRCLYLYLDYPSHEREVAIIRARVPAVTERLAWEMARVTGYLRGREDLRKKPSIAEALDWGAALVALNCQRLDSAVVEDTLNLILKNHSDQKLFKCEWASLGPEGVFAAGGKGGAGDK